MKKWKELAGAAGDFPNAAWRQPMSGKSMTKEDLLRQVDALRDIARRSRRLLQTLDLESDRRRLMAHTEGLEESATRIEKEAIGAKTFVIASGQKRSDWLA